MPARSEDRPQATPDGRYIIVKNRLWRRARPDLSEAERQELVGELMSARRAVKAAQGDEPALREARQQVDAAKRRLGERGPAWWTDGAPDLNRRLVYNTPYRAWFEELTARSAADKVEPRIKPARYRSSLSREGRS